MCVYIIHIPFLNYNILTFSLFQDVKERAIGGPKLRKHKTSRRNCCPFCMVLVTNFSRHIVKNHGFEEEVKKYLMIQDSDRTVQKQKRTACTNKLRKRGNHLYNVKVTNEKSGEELLPMKRPANQLYSVTNITHMLCRFCLGLFRKENLYLHQKTCSENLQREDFDETCSPGGSEIRNRVVKSAAVMLTPDMPEASEALKKIVLPTMTRDQISFTAQSDPLILNFGSRFYKNHRDNYHRNYVSIKMRDLARVLLAMRATNPDITYMEDCLQPKYFNDLMDVVRDLSGFNDETGECSVPSLAPRLCSSMKTCADIVVSNLVKDPNLLTPQKENPKKKMDDFLHLMTKEWKIEISSNAEKSRKKKNVGKEDILPDSEDIILVCSILSNMCEELIVRLKQEPSADDYIKLSKMLIAHIIILSRRRPGEVVRASLQHYSTVDKNDEMAALKESILNDSQKKSSSELHIFHVPGKNTRKVPCLLTKLMKKALDCLLNCRKDVGVSDDNNLLFARPFCSNLYDGTKIIDEIKSKYKLKKPQHFTATGLRHHAATVSQLSERDDTYTENLATFLGHDLAVHKQNYKIPLPMIQKGQVGHKLLQMTVKNNQSDTSFSPTGSSPCSNYVCNVDHLSSAKKDSTNNSTLSHGTEQTSSNRQSGNDEDHHDQDYQTPPTSNYNSDSEHEDSSFCLPKALTRKRWLDNEKEVIYQYFGKNIIRNTQPHRKEIKEMYEKESRLCARTLGQVVTYVNNIFTKKVKIPDGVLREIKKNLI